LSIHKIVTALFCETNPIPIKEAMNIMGVDVGPCRLPLYEMDPINKDLLKQAILDYGLEVKE
jgi:4-hydroxy-tetrahydrodipicolinate synthase